MSINKIAENIISDTADEQRCYNWKNSEYRVYYNTRTRKVWGRDEYKWESALPLEDPEVVRITISGYDLVSTKKALRKAMKLADQGWRYTTKRGEKTQLVSDWDCSMKQF